MAAEGLEPGLYEALLTPRLEASLDRLDGHGLSEQRGLLANAEAPDRVSRHIGSAVAAAIRALPEDQRAAAAVDLAIRILELVEARVPGSGAAEAKPSPSAEVLHAVLHLLPDGRPSAVERPVTPLVDTTVLTRSPGEPSLVHELRAEVASADDIDIVVAFIRWSGVRPLIEALRSHCESGKRLRVLTTTYTNSTEQRALEELTALGAEIRVSYDNSSTRLHAKSWIFRRRSGYSTAYVGSSNLTHSAQITGLEWNVRLAEASNREAVEKIQAVFESYWASTDFTIYDADEFRSRTKSSATGPTVLLSPIELELRPFQEALLERIAVSRAEGFHRNLLVAATGTGKTVMAAVDYARLRSSMERSRLLFVAHRAEILEQSLALFRHALRDASFGELWVGGQRPAEFEHVFASIQSLSANGLKHLDPSHFDVVIVDEFHHAAAPSYETLLTRLEPRELLGLTATPERADGLDILRYFDGRIAADLRVWDAIEQQHLSPFAYFGVHDGLDLRDVPWKRGRGYDINTLENVLTADHAWARRVIEQVVQKVTDAHSTRTLGFCVSVGHAQFMAARFSEAGLKASAVWGDTPAAERHQALRDLATGKINYLFTVDLFNEGVDVPAVDTLLLLRPTDSATLFLQQLGRGLRKAAGKDVCTVLDFVATHRKEFRYDLRFRALLGGSRKDVERQIERGFPFLPAGCSLELDRIAQEVVLRSVRNAVPSSWSERVRELRALGDVSLSTFLVETELELADVYDAGHSWSELREAAGLPVAPPGTHERALRRAVGRLLHLDDSERVETYRALIASTTPPDVEGLGQRQTRLLRMLIASLGAGASAGALTDAVAALWSHPGVLSELRELLPLLPTDDHLHNPLDASGVNPLAIHARYTRAEILAAFNVGSAAHPPRWQTGVWWDPESQTDFFAFTLDKTSGGFSPTTRYRDYAISRDLIHWESQSATAEQSQIGQRYINHRSRGTQICLFARLRTDDRAFWCLGPATYVRHEGERPISFVWRLEHQLPADLYTAFAAAAA